MKAIVVAILAFAAVSDAAKVTPMEKVIGLMKSLHEKVTAEGKEEAANYDKYACFCKEQADEKLYAIENSKALIKKQTASINKLDGEINKLNSEIGLLSKEIKKQEGIIESKTNTRNGEHDEYMKDANDYLGAIDACERAIAALKDSKGALSEDAKSSLALVQEKTAKIKGAPKFQYQSNHVIELLENLLDKTKVLKNELDQFEFDLKAVYDKEMVEANNALRFAEKDKAEASALSESKTEEMNTLIDERSEENTDLDSDEAFLKVLTGKCEDASNLFDQRSKSRADELTALSEATAELESEGGAADSYGAEGKLNGFVQKKVSFLQTRSVRRHIGSKFAAIQQAQVLISDAADRQKSAVLSSMALRMKVSEDHFVKVRGLIKDLIAKLKKDEQEEADQKGFCDKRMSKALRMRDTQNANLEQANADIAKAESEKEDQEDLKADLEKQIAAQKKALLEATELRASEKAANAEAMQIATDGQNSVERAISILSKYYGFLQYKPANSDRDGNTVDDLGSYAPTESYHGAGAESKGIMGILEVIRSDFIRTFDKTEEEDKLSQEAFEGIEDEINLDVKQKTALLKKTNDRITTLIDNLGQFGDDQGSAQKMLDGAEGVLAKLKPLCVDGQETYAERVEARNKEIAALKDALAILEDWQG